MTKFWESEPPWFPQVEGLKPGHKKRLNDSRIVSNNGKGFFLYDFREKDGEVYEPQLTLSQKLEAYEQAAAAALAASASAEPPLPALHNPRDWPLAARVWLHKAHFNNHDITSAGYYWNAKLRRIIMPFEVASTGEQSWIGRDVGMNGNVTKYLFPAGVRRAGGAIVRSVHQDQYTRQIVGVTEDLLSARRVSWAYRCDVVAANGTSLDREALMNLVNYDECFVWLDPDIYGQRGANKIIQDLGAFGKPVHRPKSEVDPKLMDEDAIRSAINKARYP